MEEIRIKLEKLGIDKRFSIDKIAELIKQHEDRKQKSKSLNNEITWTNQNIYLKATSIITSTKNTKKLT